MPFRPTDAHPRGLVGGQPREDPTVPTACATRRPRRQASGLAKPRTLLTVLTLTACATTVPSPLPAQAAHGILRSISAVHGRELAEFLGDPAGGTGTLLAEPLVEVDEPYVLVHLATNRVHLVDGVESLWSAPAATGNGFRLAGAGKRWTFTTPKGLFRVRRKEKDPVWVAPDWYFVEKGLPVPAQNDSSRRIPGAMGNTAIYLGDGIAIHGTSAPSLVLNPDPERRRVSHGCIRLTDESARELYHLVEVGTPVLIY